MLYFGIPENVDQGSSEKSRFQDSFYKPHDPVKTQDQGSYLEDLKPLDK